ncbi:GH23203, partial [Drosophila grimshawi]
IEKCHFGDSKCLVRSINDFVRNYPKNAAEIGLPTLDAINVKDVSVPEKPNDAPIYLSFYFTNNVYKGFNNATITHVTGFNKNPTKDQIEIQARIPSLVHEATYHMQGRYLLFVANTTDKLLSDYQNLQLTITIKITLEYRNNKRYLKIYELVPKADLDRWIVWMDNLYRENTDLTIALNHIMNEHWVEFWNGVEPTILKNIATCLEGMLSKFFETVSYDDMFLPVEIWNESSDY